MNKHLLAFMRTADVWRMESTCTRVQVGAVIVDDNNRLLSIGYNGTKSGFKHCNDYFSVHDGLYYVRKDIPLKINIKQDTKSDWYEVTKEQYRKIHHAFSELYEVHAEQNAIYNLVKTGVSAKNMTLFTTTEPCAQCAKAIAALGITTVYYAEAYDNNTTNIPVYLRRMGVKCKLMKL